MYRKVPRISSPPPLPPKKRLVYKRAYQRQLLIMNAAVCYSLKSCWYQFFSEMFKQVRGSVNDYKDASFKHETFFGRLFIVLYGTCTCSSVFGSNGTACNSLCSFSVKGYPVIDGVLKMNNNTFARFFNNCAYSTYAIGNNPESLDAVPPINIIGTTKLNVQLTSLAYFYNPNPAWVNQDVCCSYLSLNVIVIIYSFW